MAEARSVMNDASARRVTIANQRGLHARAAAKFVKLAETLEAEVTVIKNEVEVPGRSIMGLMMLAAAPGSEIEIRSEGPDASAALLALVRLVEAKFHEE